MLQNQKSSSAKEANPDFNSLLNEFEESITTQIQEKFNKIEQKLQFFEANQSKQIEDSEGRDGLILQ
jgi:hypothetical protein